MKKYLALILSLPFILTAAPSEFERSHTCPTKLPAEFLAPERHPRMVISREQLATARRNATETDFGRRYLADCRKIAAPFLEFDDETLRKLVPPPGEVLIYGLGMNLGPDGKRLVWRGAESPALFDKTFDASGRAYPNAEFPDNGKGYQANGKTYYFKGVANGAALAFLESRLIPALAECYLLTGERRYAHTASVLLDAIAAIYPGTRRGPLDYPVLKEHQDRGGRLQRPYYQASGALLRFAAAIDLIAASGELNRPSAAVPGMTVRENLIRNLLWDGAVFALQFVQEGRQLHNGHIEYLLGPAAVGLLLGEKQFSEPVFSPVIGLPAILDTSFDRNGFYYESSNNYMTHALNLIGTLADLQSAGVRLGMGQAEPAYDAGILPAAMLRSFDRLEVGGHVPLTGDDGPDTGTADPSERNPTRVAAASNYLRTQEVHLRNQSNFAWMLLAKSGSLEIQREAAKLLRQIYHDTTPEPPPLRDLAWLLTPERLALIAQQKWQPDYFETRSTFYGGKGFALLRGGTGTMRHGAQLLAGFLHNHAQSEALTWTFFHRGAEWSFDPGHFNTHYRFGWTRQAVAHQSLLQDRRNPDNLAGNGFLTAFHDGDSVQWAAGTNPYAYSGDFRRLIAQIQQKDGSLGYFLDVGLLGGGTMREDSFHSVMRNMESAARFSALKAFSLDGNSFQGMAFRADFRLDKFPDKPFYWMPPGNGYGFLIAPASRRDDGNVRIILSNAAFPAVAAVKQQIAVDFPGEPGREYLKAENMTIPQLPAVPYLLRRDEGAGKTSVFAKIIHFAPENDKFPVQSVEPVPMTDASAPWSRAWRIVLTGGDSDLWLFGGGKAGKAAIDAGFAVFRSDASGRLFYAAGSGCSRLQYEGRILASGKPAATGTVVAWEQKPELALTVKWDTPVSTAGTLLTAVSPYGHRSNWTIASIDGGKIMLRDRKLSLAKVELTPVKGKRNVFSYAPAVAQFYGSGGNFAPASAIGRAVYCDGKYLGRIVQITERELELDGNSAPPERCGVEILELAPGDRFEVPSNLVFKTKSMSR